MLSNKVSEIMTRDLITASPSTSVRQVMELMVERRVGRVVIVDNGEPVGIFTEQDVVRRVMNRKLDIDKTTIRRVMTTPIHAVAAGTPIVDVLGRMYKGRFRHLLVRGEKDTRVGLVSMRRILKLAVELGRGVNDIRTVGSIMSGNLLTVEPALSVFETIDKLIKTKSGYVIVSSKGEAAGIFTERDVLKRVALEPSDMGKVPVSDVMTANPITKPTSALVQEVLTNMYENGFRHMPILDDNAAIAGIVSMADVLKYAKALDIDDVVRKAWKEIEEFWGSDENYTPG